MPNMHTLSDRILAKRALLNAITAASNTSSAIDTLGYARAAVIFTSAPSGSGTTSDCKLQDGSASDGSDAADITGAAFTQVTTAGGAKIQIMNIDLSKRKRYLTVVHTGAGGSAAGQVNATVLLFNGEGMPPTQDVTPVSI